MPMNQLIKISNQSTEILETIQNAKFTNFTQTTNFHTQDLFQTIFLAYMHYQIT